MPHGRHQHLTLPIYPKNFLPGFAQISKMTLGASKTADFRLTAEKSLACEGDLQETFVPQRKNCQNSEGGG
jgi:hypothetical protein